MQKIALVPFVLALLRTFATHIFEVLAHRHPHHAGMFHLLGEVEVVFELQPTALFFGVLSLTAITDNAALTYLGSLIAGLPERVQYMFVAGAVAGGGLTVIANAPNPAGAALLRRGFNDESTGAVGLLLGALAPTCAAACVVLVVIYFMERAPLGPQ